MAKRQGKKQEEQVSGQAQVRLDVKTDTPFYYRSIGTFPARFPTNRRNARSPRRARKASLARGMDLPFYVTAPIVCAAASSSSGTWLQSRRLYRISHTVH